MQIATFGLNAIYLCQIMECKFEIIYYYNVYIYICIIYIYYYSTYYN